MKSEPLQCKNIAIGFVIYFPEVNFLARLAKVSNAGFKFYLFDNSPENNIVRDFCKKSDKNKYITCGKNVGLGYGMSAICAQAYYDSFTTLLYLDQDTFFNEETLDFINSFYLTHSELDSEYSAIVFNSKSNQKEKKLDNYCINNVLLSISSGSLFFLKNLKAINWHNTNYFVDCVDYEFCLNSNNHNLKVGEYSRIPGFDHISGQPDEKYRIFGKERFIRKYSNKRFFDYLSASFKLLFQSLRTLNFKFTIASFRALLIYVYFQIIIIGIKLFKIKSEYIENDKEQDRI
jgi:rhamnosyltransferase